MERHGHARDLERGHAVGVLPYDPVLQEFVLIEQVRIGALATSSSPWLIEIIAGMIDEGETQESVCHRESMEEAGITLDKLTKALSYLSSPGGTTERLHIFIAKTDASQAHGIHGLDSESEDIKVHRIKENTALEWLENGHIDNAAAVIALQTFFMPTHNFWSSGRHRDSTQPTKICTSSSFHAGALRTELLPCSKNFA